MTEESSTDGGWAAKWRRQLALAAQVMGRLWPAALDCYDRCVLRLKEGSRAVPFHQVLQRELEVIGKKRGRPIPEPQPQSDPEEKAARRALDANLTGLAFSGGGIRSATFNLGVIQALADFRLLRFVDYLSTVSGGGYIGSWLTALIDRENRKSGDEAKKPEPADEAKRPEPADEAKEPGVRKVEKRLSTRRDELVEPEDPAITWLRQYSNYLTPNVGLLTADTWTTIAVYLRNLVLNLLVLVSGLAVLPLVPRILKTLHPASQLTYSYPLVSLVLGVLATCVMGYSFASLDEKAAAASKRNGEDRRLNPRLQRGFVQAALVTPLLLSAFLASHWLPEQELGIWRWAAGTSLAYGLAWQIAATMAHFTRWNGRGARWLWLAGLIGGGILLWALEAQNLSVAAAVVFAAAWLVVAALAKWLEWDRAQVRWCLLIAGASVSGAVGGLALSWLAGQIAVWPPWMVAAWATPLIMIWFILLGVVHTGLMGCWMLDRQREWLNHLGAWLLIFTLAWAAVFALVVYGPVLVFAFKGWWMTGLASGWVLSTLAGLMASRGAGEGGRWRGLVMAVAPYAFVVGLLVLLAVGMDWGLGRFADAEDHWAAFSAQTQVIHQREAARRIRAAAQERAGERPRPPARGWLGELYGAHVKLLDATTESRLLLLLAIAAGLCGVGGILALRIDVNEFSMHRFYRNRLVRAYLGASVEPKRRTRLRQPFTGFYKDDDLDLGGLGLSAPGPFPIINTALNLVAGEELAWQQRKAASFVLTPLFCGFEVRRDAEEVADPESRIEPHGYRPTRDPSHPKLAYGGQPTPLTLGSAFAISGAAASPNMGFRTTPAFAFLLTVFNVRLGWWLGNPRHRWTWTRSGPFTAILQLFRELTGTTRGRTRYVYLSDGGHFENLGLYELVRRRCRFILVCDAGADPKHEFDDLGNAIRKCRADFGVEIDIHVDALRRDPESGLCTWHCAVGKILYSKHEHGLLLYVKASLTGDEPEDILNYARGDDTFPHQTTADQFFDESQFESYRRLGHHVAGEVLKRAVDRATTCNGKANGESPATHFEPEKMWLALEQQWWPPRHAADAFTRHTATLDKLYERQRSSPSLGFLDAQFYPEWPRLVHDDELPDDLPASPWWLPPGEDERREGFYFCNSLIQLMENVYLDLDLEKDYDHPDNRGWMNLFTHWAWSGMFRVTWSISAATYGQRFQAFCRERLDLELGDVQTASLELGESSPAAFQTGLEQRQTDFLNFLEREQARLFLSYGGIEVRRVIQLRLSLHGAEEETAKPLLCFGFGYALLDRDDKLAFFRVQNHLRLMGLGRRALRRLALEVKERGGKLQLHPEAEQALQRVVVARGEQDPGRKRANEAARERFENEFKVGVRPVRTLLDSVHREIEEG